MPSPPVRAVVRVGGFKEPGKICVQGRSISKVLVLRFSSAAAAQSVFGKIGVTALCCCKLG